MNRKLSKMLDNVSSVLEARKGLLPVIGMFCVALNFILQLIISNWFTTNNFFLHVGIILAIIGFLLAWAL